MPDVRTDLPYQEWVAYLFDRPVEDPAWYWNVDLDDEQILLRPDILVDHTARLFTRSATDLESYSDAQIDQGLWFLVGEATTELGVLAGNTVSESARLNCIGAISTLFEECFAKRCTDHLSHIDEAGCSPLNSICYMWWDVFPIYGSPASPSRKNIDAACLAAMKQTLGLKSVACQESALHGLGHWAIYYEASCQAIIDEYLLQVGDIRQELYKYAVAAKHGRVN